MTRLPATPALPATTVPGRAAAGPLIPSTRLFAGARTVLIEHAGQHYQLRITRENKLILTK